jgi:hypothetical protein
LFGSGALAPSLALWTIDNTSSTDQTALTDNAASAIQKELTSGVTDNSSSTVGLAVVATTPADAAGQQNSNQALALATDIGTGIGQDAMTAPLSDLGAAGSNDVASGSSSGFTGSVVVASTGFGSGTQNQAPVGVVNLGQNPTPLLSGQVTGISQQELQASGVVAQQAGVGAQQGAIDNTTFLSTVLTTGTQLAEHSLVQLKIYVDGVKQVIPEGIGVEPNGVLPVHTQCTCGIIHLESTTAHAFQLQDFFQTWGQTFNSHDILGHETDATHIITMTVNGKVSHAFGSLTLHNSDHIEIRYSQANGNGLGGGGDIQPLDDVVNILVHSGSSIQIKSQNFGFGDEPPTSYVNNVTVTDDGSGAGTMSAAMSDVVFKPIEFNIGPAHGFATLRAQTDLSGTYDRNTGSATATLDMDVHLESDAPNFDNVNCNIPRGTLNFTTDAGTPFSGGAGMMVDNTFVVDAIPHGACGMFFGNDYADIVNSFLGLPSQNSGDNVLTLNLTMDPPLAP